MARWPPGGPSRLADGSTASASEASPSAQQSDNACSCWAKRGLRWYRLAARERPPEFARCVAGRTSLTVVWRQPLPARIARCEGLDNLSLDSYILCIDLFGVSAEDCFLLHSPPHRSSPPFTDTRVLTSNYYDNDGDDYVPPTTVSILYYGVLQIVTRLWRSCGLPPSISLTRSSRVILCICLAWRGESSARVAGVGRSCLSPQGVAPLARRSRRSCSEIPPPACTARGPPALLAWTTAT